MVGCGGQQACSPFQEPCQQTVGRREFIRPISSSTQRNNGTNKNAISKALYEHISYAQRLRFAVTTSKVQAVRTRAVAVNLGKLKAESDGAFTSHFATPSPGYVGSWGLGGEDVVMKRVGDTFLFFVYFKYSLFLNYLAFG